VCSLRASNPRGTDADLGGAEGDLNEEQKGHLHWHWKSVAV